MPITCPSRPVSVNEAGDPRQIADFLAEEMRALGKNLTVLAPQICAQRTPPAEVLEKARERVLLIDELLGQWMDYLKSAERRRISQQPYGVPFSSRHQTVLLDGGRLVVVERRDDTFYVTVVRVVTGGTPTVEWTGEAEGEEAVVALLDELDVERGGLSLRLPANPMPLNLMQGHELQARLRSYLREIELPLPSALPALLKRVRATHAVVIDGISENLY